MLARAPWQWMSWKPSRRIYSASWRRILKMWLPPQIMVGMPKERASPAKGPSRKQTSWAVMVLFRFWRRLSTWVLAPPESPPLMR